MSSHDLLNYSIMHNNTKTNHYYHNNTNIVSLPPLTPIIKQLSENHDHSSIVLPPLTRLPSNSNLNYITSTTSIVSNSSTGTTTPTNTNRLTEHNLLHLSDSFNKQTPTTSSTFSNSSNNHHGLGLLSSAISSLQRLPASYHHIKQVDEPKTNPPSLTSASSVGSLSPVSSPSMTSASLTSKITKSHSNTSNSSTNKRRQRLGPSCDSCRLRKVKCNAEIIILAKSMEDINQNQLIYQYNLSSVELERLLNQSQVITKVDQVDNNEEIHLLISNSKLIKYKFCNSCNSKGLNCCFSKGFTKEDIMVNNKKSNTNANISSSNNVTTIPIITSPVIKKEKPIKIAKKVNSSPVINNTKTISSLTAALTKSLTESSPITNIINHLEPQPIIEEKAVLIPASHSPTISSILTDNNSNQSSNNNTTRKSSCISCRKRKVKCVYSSVLNKCEGCYKKNHDCKFDVNTVKQLIN
ncbi:hypothetical protein DFJ63DRAFT_335315 [Scheffersomyces coipomensis]|uniref:uncharacterized protein n=1 Tax=Scheffersomyces coipomensis TaxID=1788519 RepID=UPI00315CCFA6